MEYKHPWIPITKDTEKEMLASIGKKSLDDLFCNIPEKFRVKHDLNLPPSHSEFEVSERIQELAGNATMLYYMTEEAQEGKNAFLEKRKPDWDQFPKLP